MCEASALRMQKAGRRTHYPGASRGSFVVPGAVRFSYPLLGRPLSTKVEIRDRIVAAATECAVTPEDSLATFCSLYHVERDDVGAWLDGNDGCDAEAG